MDNEVAEGVGSIGKGEDKALDLEGRTAARPMGQPIRIGQRDGLVAMSGQTPVVEAWLDPASVRFSVDEDLAMAASILDDRGVVSAVLCRCDRRVFGGPLPGDPHISTPFQTLAIGSRSDGGEAEVIVVYMLADEPTADTASGEIGDTFRDGVVFGGGVRIADTVTATSVDVEGRSVVVTLRFVSDSPLPATIFSWLTALATPFVYAP